MTIDQRVTLTVPATSSHTPKLRGSKSVCHSAPQLRNWPMGTSRKKPMASRKRTMMMAKVVAMETTAQRASRATMRFSPGRRRGRLRSARARSAPSAVAPASAMLSPPPARGRARPYRGDSAAGP